MKTDEREKMLHDLSTTEKADSMDFVVTRTDPKPNQTFSADALDELLRSVNDFVGARLRYHWYKGDGSVDPTVPGPSNIKVEVRVTIDDKHYEPFATERPWYVIDGTNRTIDA